MPILAILLVALQVFFAAHAIRNGKDSIWLWIIILAPGIGCALYFITQFGPEAANSRTARRARNTLLKAVDPQRELRTKMEQLEISNTVENRLALADECMEARMYADAIALLKGSLTGMHATEPGIMQRLAVAYFESGDPGGATRTLTELVEANPGYRSPEGHLLYARSLEAGGDTDAALKEYEALYSTYPGEEGRVRYGLLLKKVGEPDKARALFRESLLRARQAPKHYRRKESDWLAIAEREQREVRQ